MVAAHFGMRSRNIWHYWFPAFDPAYEKFSPGITLLLKMAQAAQGLGISVIDLGKGNQAYKQRLMNRAIPLAEGFVEVPSLISAARAVKRRSETLLRHSPTLLSVIRRLFGLARGARLHMTVK
jgi:CelD/BcsL family acetyltransferase involved in cellulose biosynthesis